MSGQEYVGEREAQQIVGCGRTMLWKLVRNGKVVKQKLSNKNVYRRDDLLRFLASLPKVGGPMS